MIPTKCNRCGESFEILTADYLGSCAWCGYTYQQRRADEQLTYTLPLTESDLLYTEDELEACYMCLK